MKKLVVILGGVFTTLMIYGPLFAQTHEAVAAGGDSPWLKPFLALSSGLAIGISAFAGAFGQSRAAAAALEGIARNPGAAAKVQTPMIIALALIESLVIYGLVVAFLLQGKI